MTLPKYSEWLHINEENLFEASRHQSGGVGSKITAGLINKDPKSYSHHSEKRFRVKVHGDKSDADIIADIGDLLDDEIIDWVVIEKGNSPKNITAKDGSSYSGEYSTIEFKNPVTGKWTWLTPARTNPDSKSTSIHLKEIMVCIFSRKNSDFRPVTKENYFEQLAYIERRLGSDLSKLGISLAPTEVQEVRNDFLEAMDRDWNKGLQDAINNGKSAGREISLKYNNYFVHRDKLFNEIKRVGSQASGRRDSDKWCPMDIVLRNPNASVRDIYNLMSDAQGSLSQTEKLGKINRMFEYEWGKTTEPLVGISLKQEKARHGKAKGALPKEGDIAKDYNVDSSDEELFRTNPNKGLAKLMQYRKYLAKVLQSKSNNFTSSSRGQQNTKWTNKDDAFAKYAAIKMANWLMSQADHGNNIFLELAEYGLSLGKNPAFFKVTGNDKGGTGKVQTFPNGGGVSFVKENEPVMVTDTNDNKGIIFEYNIDFLDNIYYVKLSCRTNSRASIQVTLEIDKFDKKGKA